MASKFALVIANTEYQDASFAKLTAPGKDAEEFAEVLRDAEVTAFDEVQVLLNEGESKTRRAIAHFFVDRKPTDLLLLYFSGHGVRNEQGQLFLATNDTEIKILDATGIPAEFITRAMNYSRSQRQLLILDCCNSGAFAHGSKSASGVGKSMGIATAFEGDGYGRVVLTATDATQYAWEGDKVIGDTQKSVFTHFLIEGLKGEADADGDGRIKVDELYDYAYEQVVRRTPKQTPGKWAYKQQGDLVLRENLKPRDVKPVPLPPDLVELLSYPNFSARKAGIQELIILLEGKHLGLARTAEEKLREIATNDSSLDLRKTASDTLIAYGLVVDQIKPSPLETPQSINPNQALLLKEKAERKQSPQPFPALSLKSNSLLAWRPIGLVAVGLLLIGFLIWGAPKLLQSLAAAPEATHTLSTGQVMPQPSTEVLVTSTSTETSIPPTPTLGIGSTIVSEKDDMTLVYIPAGDYLIPFSTNPELPDSQLTHVKAFWIDKTEVTNKMYSLCVTAGACLIPNDIGSSTRENYYGASTYENYPVIYVDQQMAEDYCAWANRRLPTHSEWKLAAGGSDTNRKYPWGNDSPEDYHLNFDSSVGDTTEVGRYPRGASPYGVLDMAGNVGEWAADSPESPVATDEKEILGGDWTDDADSVAMSVITHTSPNSPGSFNNTGFRCALSIGP